MKFGLEVSVLHDEKSVSLRDLGANAELAKAVFAKPEQVEGAIVPVVNGKPAMEAVNDPLFALLEQWVLKLPWCLAGDTETVFLKNSEHAFGFEPMNEALALSFYKGEGNEVDEYVLEPVPVGLELFCEASIAAVKTIVGLATKSNAALADQADVKTLREALAEAERALKDFRHQR